MAQCSRLIFTADARGDLSLESMNMCVCVSVHMSLRAYKWESERREDWGVGVEEDKVEVEQHAAPQCHTMSD